MHHFTSVTFFASFIDSASLTLTPFHLLARSLSRLYSRFLYLLFDFDRIVFVPRFNQKIRSCRINLTSLLEGSNANDVNFLGIPFVPSSCRFWSFRCLFFFLYFTFSEPEEELAKCDSTSYKSLTNQYHIRRRLKSAFLVIRVVNWNEAMSTRHRLLPAFGYNPIIFLLHWIQRVCCARCVLDFSQFNHYPVDGVIV